MFRRYYGKGTDMAAIESAIRQAEVGRMSDLTDLETESLGIDPHLAGIISNKRIGPISMLPRRCEPAEGDDVDKVLAVKYANVVSRCMSRIPRMTEVRAKLRELATKFADKKVTLVDLEAPTRTQPKLYDVDGVHMTAAGYRLLAETLRPHVAP